MRKIVLFKMLFLQSMQSLKNSLFITFDGLTDPLGQSQILPYLCGISKNGFQITIISCEKKSRLKKEEASVVNLLKDHGISWKYILYDEDGGFISRWSYIKEIKNIAFAIQHSDSFSLVHCRSYLASLVGLKLKQKFKTPFLFDMRGFWADERIDGGIWNKKKPLERLFYNYFKRKEKQFITQSDAMVSLTHAGVNELSKVFGEDLILPKTTVIPCCTNTQLFQKKDITTYDLHIDGLSANDELLVYSGSIGTWYYTKEMIDCVLIWQQKIPTIKLLILTKDEDALKDILKKYTPREQQIVLTASATYQEMPKYLSKAKASIFFIKPAYSKIASSPTKMAECWAMNLPIITNSGIGDNDLYFKELHGGVLIDEFTNAAYLKALNSYLELPKKSINYRQLALSYFDKEMAIEKYSSIYKRLTQ